MLLKLRKDKRLVTVENTDELINPFHGTLHVRPQWGEEEQEAEIYSKTDLCFPSGEDLPRCWLDEHYRDEEVAKHHPRKTDYGL